MADLENEIQYHSLIGSFNVNSNCPISAILKFYQSGKSNKQTVPTLHWRQYTLHILP